MRLSLIKHTPPPLRITQNMQHNLDFIPYSSHKPHLLPRLLNVHLKHQWRTLTDLDRVTIRDDPILDTDEDRISEIGGEVVELEPRDVDTCGCVSLVFQLERGEGKRHEPQTPKAFREVLISIRPFSSRLISLLTTAAAPVILPTRPRSAK